MTPWKKCISKAAFLVSLAYGLLAFPVGIAFAQTVSFTAATNFTVGDDPLSVAVGDFNGDGKRDLAVANFNSDNVSILLGSGDGGFGPATNFAAGDGPGSVAAGDFNGDGKVDLAATNFNSNNVSVLLGVGDGTFGAATSFAVGTGPESVTTGDFNGDGKPDLAVGNGNSDNVSILLGTGTGLFGAATNFVVGDAPFLMAIGDFNGDGKQDLAVTNQFSNNVSILLGTGTGSFGSATDFTVGDRPISAVIGDFNGDGKQDLAVTNFLSDNVSILLGVGDGTFGAATNLAVAGGPRLIGVADFNGDGKPDLAVANADSNNISILVGTGTGSFGTATNFSVGSNPFALTLGDFDADGKADLVVANENGDNVSILLNATVFNPSGSFAAATNLTIGAGPEVVALADFNGDGKQDLAVANFNSDNVSILLGTGTGSFGTATNFTAGSSPASVAVGDFNGDGKLDLAVANYDGGNVSVLLGAGDGTFGAATNFTVGDAPDSVAVGDFNGDGKLDLAVANFASDNISILLGVGDGSFGAAVNFAAGDAPEALAVGDFNGDGKLDVAVANGDSDNVSILLGTGTGTFGLATNFAAGDGAHSVVIADFNGDGKQDLVVANQFGDDVSILLGTGTGSFGAAANFPAGDRPIFATVGDFNGDGKLDLAVPNINTNNVSILLGTGTGSFGTATNFAVGDGPHSAAVGDFNQDGRPDLAVTNHDSANVSILLNGTPTIAINDVTVAEGNSGTVDAVFAVTLSQASTQTVTVSFATADGTATSPSDYASNSGVVTFNPGETSKTITVVVNGDTLVEPNETFFVNLSNATNTTIADDQGVGTINSDDVALAVVTVEATDSTATEAGSTTGTLTFTRTGPLTSDLTVNYTVSGTATPDSDYTAILANVIIPAGSATATRTITPLDDGSMEVNETVIVTLNADSNYEVGTANSATVTIVDDDAPSVSINNATVTEGSSGTVNAVFTVSLSQASPLTVMITFATADGTATAGSDYVSNNGTLTFNPGETSKTISVAVNGDTVLEPNETFFLNLTGATNATITDNQGLGTIIDDSSELTNLSTRARVLTGDNVVIGGFIIEGPSPKTVLIRARGPSMTGAPFFVPGTLANPSIQLFSGQTAIAQNNDWQATDPLCGSPAVACGGVTQIIATGLDPCQPNPGQSTAPPGCAQESAIHITLPPGGYTAIVTGVGGSTGVGLVEVFEVDGTGNPSILVNISTRGPVQTADNVMIVGIIIAGSAPKTMLIRGRGPSMAGAPFDVPGTLVNPFLQVFSGSSVIAQNDDWQDLPNCSPGIDCGGPAEIIATGLDPCQPNPDQSTPPPGCVQESAIYITLPPGGYTAIVSGVGGATGVGLVEAFEEN